MFFNDTATTEIYTLSLHDALPILVIEAMAQVGAVGVMSGGEHSEKLALFAGIDGVRFRRQVLPGDVLRMEVEIERLKGRVGRGRGRATVGAERVCEAELMFAFEIGRAHV